MGLRTPHRTSPPPPTHRIWIPTGGRWRRSASWDSQAYRGNGISGGCSLRGIRSAPKRPPPPPPPPPAPLCQTALPSEISTNQRARCWITWSAQPISPHQTRRLYRASQSALELPHANPASLLSGCPISAQPPSISAARYPIGAQRSPPPRSAIRIAAGLRHSPGATPTREGPGAAAPPSAPPPSPPFCHRAGISRQGKLQISRGFVAGGSQSSRDCVGGKPRETSQIGRHFVPARRGACVGRSRAASQWRHFVQGPGRREPSV